MLSDAGAPLVPVFHHMLARALPRPLAVLNLGGIGNVTCVAADAADLLAFDTGPGNALLDQWMALHGAGHMDVGGAAASRGQVDATCLAAALAHPFLARPPPKSLDRADFTLDPVRVCCASPCRAVRDCSRDWAWRMAQRRWPR